MRELRPGARTVLRGRNLPEALPAVASAQPPECLHLPDELARIGRLFEGLTDWHQCRPDFRMRLSNAVEP